MSRLSIINRTVKYHTANRRRGVIRAVCTVVPAIYSKASDDFWCGRQDEMTCNECPIDSTEKWEDNVKCLD